MIKSYLTVTPVLAMSCVCYVYYFYVYYLLRLLFDMSIICYVWCLHGCLLVATRLMSPSCPINNESDYYSN